MTRAPSADIAMPQRARLPWVAIGLITLLAALLRWYDAGHSLWLDELHSSWTIEGPWSEIAARARWGNRPPLFFWLLRLSTAWMVPSEWSLRGLSLLAGTALVPISYAIVKRMSGSAFAGCVAAMAVALDPLCLYYSQDANPYALLQCVAALQVATFYRLLHNTTARGRVALVGLSLLAFYLHYTAWLMLCGEWVALWIARRRSAYSLSAASADAALILLGSVPAWPHLAEIAARRENWEAFIRQAPWTDLFTRFPLICGVLVPLGLLWLLERRSARLGPRQSRAALGLLACWFLVPLLVTWSLTWLDLARLFYRRYLVSVAVAPLWIGGILAARGSSTGRRTAIALAMLVALQIQGGPIREWLQYRRVSDHLREDWRGAVALLNQHRTDPAAPLLVDAGLIECGATGVNAPAPPRDYCLLPLRGIYRVGERGEVVHPMHELAVARQASAIGAQVRASGQLWLLVRGGASARETAERAAMMLARTAGVELRKVNEWPLPGVTVIELRADAYYARSSTFNPKAT